ncbi:hypothetical protein OEZ85_000392 [Tetradesmus obliquus]|uniref:Symplekin/Pta1 N-terminal domain-containing protein n=1 Tax=Tetradesmus obliquus TaxID=3088 RepID=A0ABY8UTP2_TETOB|nr:hypothetical protein OEZ85_000392 [Tetradesmus obliquus]
MGRVVSSSRLSLGQGGRQRLVLIAAAQIAGVSAETMEGRMQELLLLLPDLSSLLPSLHPRVLAALGSDTQGVAQKLIKLRLLFPAADVSQMISRRPTLLLDEHFEQVEEARAKLVARLAPQPGSSSSDSSSSSDAAQPNMLGTTGGSSSSEQGPQANAAATAAAAAAAAAGVMVGGGAGTTPLLDGLVSRQPLLLVRDVDCLLDELERLMPGTRVLSLLQNNPDMLLMVQRGSRQLGPGAEFMSPY